MRRPLSVLAACIVAVSVAAADEILIRAKEIELPRDVLCGGRTLRAGAYGLEAGFDRQTRESRLTIFRKSKDLCVIPGGGSGEYGRMDTTKARLFTRVNRERSAIQVDVVVPTRERASMPNQVFFLPLADAD